MVMPSVESKFTLKFLDRLGDRLVEEGLISKNKLEDALREKEKTKKHLGEILLKMNLISVEKLNEFIAKQLAIPTVDLSSYTIDPEVISLFDEKIARRYNMLPLFKIENAVTVAMADPLDIFALDNVKGMIQFEIEPVIASAQSIMKAIDHYFGTKDHIQEMVGEMEKEEKRDLISDKEQLIREVEELRDDKPIIKIVNSVITQAVQEEASDIHIEPEKDNLRIRFRVDGFLYDVSSLPKRYHLPIISRIKIQAKMDIGEKRKPQDGKIHLNLGDKKVDLRISTYPVVYGEKMAIRILDLSKAQVMLEEIGLSEENLEKYREILKGGTGIVLVTGPTGSGKTTTLYATLNYISTGELNITTIEDPIEYQLENINQGQVDEKAGITFPTALRTILRQDPDVIMVGEIRDKETAELAIQAALTGHLVLSTLHTNDAAGAITRLLDMGIEPFLLSSTIKGVIAQRLVRMICPKCKKTHPPNQEILEKLGYEDQIIDLSLYKGKGCSFCRNSGYKGRTGVFELLVTDDKISDLITNKSPSHRIKEEAINAGMISLQKDALSKVFSGSTTLEEIIRVIGVVKKKIPEKAVEK
jgi:type IV pilus assembly protein PilB